MTAQEVKTELLDACKNLYESKKYLIDERSNELTIASQLATYLREKIKDWDIDTDYRREGIERVPKRDLDGIIIIPDIVIHKHGPNGPNLAAIEIKGYWNNEDRGIDIGKLKAIRMKHNYSFLFTIELDKDDAMVTEVDGVI